MEKYLLLNSVMRLYFEVLKKVSRLHVIKGYCVQNFGWIDFFFWIFSYTDEWVQLIFWLYLYSLLVIISFFFIFTGRYWIIKRTKQFSNASLSKITIAIKNCRKTNIKICYGICWTTKQDINYTKFIKAFILNFNYFSYIYW